MLDYIPNLICLKWQKGRLQFPSSKNGQGRDLNPPVPGNILPLVRISRSTFCLKPWNEDLKLLKHMFIKYELNR